jgi:hypothetical protein
VTAATADTHFFITNAQDLQKCTGAHSDSINPVCNLPGKPDTDEVRQFIGGDFPISTLVCLPNTQHCSRQGAHVAAAKMKCAVCPEHAVVLHMLMDWCKEARQHKRTSKYFVSPEGTHDSKLNEAL